MKRTLTEIEKRARAHLEAHGHSKFAGTAATQCAWLEGVGYPGLKLLLEAASDPPPQIALVKDALGLDLKGVSCLFLAPQVHEFVKSHGRVFLRNVRHGLYLLPDSVNGNYGIGCPVDPSFALGGERSKNPYAEKLGVSGRDGVEVDEALWQALAD